MAQTSAHVVSPASAFWGVAAIALNTMSQPSGRVLGLPKKHAFALRSSPVICGLNFIDTVLEFCYHLFRTRSPCKAATEIVRFRLANLSHIPKDEFEVLRSNTIFRAIMFFLGALPQAVKIYTMKGALWTQILATIYLATFFLDEVLFAMVTKEGLQPSNLATCEQPLPSRYWVWCAFIALAVSVLLPQAVVSASSYTLGPNLSYQKGVVLLSVAAAIFVLHLCGTWLSYGIASALCGIPLLLLWNVSTNAMWFGWMVLEAAGADSVDDLHGRTIRAVAVSVIAKVLTSVWTFNKVLNNIGPRYKAWTHFELSAYYLVLHLGAAGLGYAFLYDAEATWKPHWTNLLG